MELGKDKLRTWERMLTELDEGNTTYLTKNGKRVAVVVSAEHYDDMMESLARLSDLER